MNGKDQVVSVQIHHTEGKTLKFDDIYYCKNTNRLESSNLSLNLKYYYTYNDFIRAFVLKKLRKEN